MLHARDCLSTDKKDTRAVSNFAAPRPNYQPPPSRKPPARTQSAVHDLLPFAKKKLTRYLCLLIKIDSVCLVCVAKCVIHI